MCGIAGKVGATPQSTIAEADLIAMRDAMTHRGPDDAGHYLAPGIGLASRRLAILDLSPRGRMPMSAADGRYRIVYNGEVYNFPALRSRLEGLGWTFDTGTDTEVVLKSYAQWGPDAVAEFNGMFALAIWDERERSLFLARDHTGIKPLYYVETPDGLLFGSEEKTLFAAGHRPEFDPSCWGELLTFRYVSGEKTPFLGVKRLLPGHSATYRDGKLTIRRWWRLDERARALRSERAVDPDPIPWFRDLFEESVNMRRISDVPVGVLLSGGLDSGATAATLGKVAGRGLSSFTVKFPPPGYDESPLAREVAERWGLEPHELVVEPTELLSRMRKASWFNDEPLNHGNDLHVQAISKLAKSTVTVLLSGEGADETLGGYLRYRPLCLPSLAWSAAKAAARPLTMAGKIQGQGRLAKLIKTAQSGDARHRVAFGAAIASVDELRGDLGLAAEVDPLSEYRRQMLDEAIALYPREPARQAMHQDQHIYLCSLLDKNDRMTMAESIECRLPFLDHRLVEGIAATPTKWLVSPRRGKTLLRRAMADRLPESILTHRKWGFAAPWARHLRETPELRDYLREVPRMAPFDSAPLDRTKLEAQIAGFLDAPADAPGQSWNSDLMLELAVLAIWHESSVVGNRR